MKKIIATIVLSLSLSLVGASCAIGDGIWECDVTADPFISCNPLKTGPPQTFHAPHPGHVGRAPQIVPMLDHYP